MPASLHLQLQLDCENNGKPLEGLTGLWSRLLLPMSLRRASQVAQCKRIRLSMQDTQETQDQLLGQEDALEEEMATHSSILA